MSAQSEVTQSPRRAYELIRFAAVTVLMMGAIVAAPIPFLLGYIYLCGRVHACL